MLLCLINMRVRLCCEPTVSMRRVETAPPMILGEVCRRLQLPGGHTTMPWLLIHTDLGMAQLDSELFFLKHLLKPILC